MRIRARIAGGLLALACAACSRAGEPRQAHVLRIADWSEPTSLNPLLAHDQDTIGLDLLFCQTLVGLSHDNKLVPILLRRVPTRANGDISADGKTIVYRLRPDVRFADGQPLTSRDVVFTYHAVMDPRNPVLSQDAYRRIAALAAPDARTVVVHLRSPWNAAVRELFAQSDFAFGILASYGGCGSRRGIDPRYPDCDDADQRHGLLGVANYGPADRRPSGPTRDPRRARSRCDRKGVSSAESSRRSLLAAGVTVARRQFSLDQPKRRGGGVGAERSGMARGRRGPYKSGRAARRPHRFAVRCLERIRHYRAT